MGVMVGLWWGYGGVCACVCVFGLRVRGKVRGGFETRSRVG